MKLSVIIPAYNEERRLPETLKKVKEYFGGQNFKSEIIVVDDGSGDKTSKYADISYRENMGKGFAVKKGFEAATGDFILFLDADNATPIEEFPKLLAVMKTADIAIGSRYMPESRIERKQSLMRILIGRLGNLFIQTLLLKNIRDTQCGFKLFKAKVGKELFSNLKTFRFGFDIEILAIASTRHFKIIEVPVTWLHNSESRVRPIRDALRTFFDLLKILRIVKLSRN